MPGPASSPVVQRTVGHPFTLSGIGLHTGRRATVTVDPAPVGHGIRFVVGPGGREAEVALDWTNRAPSRMNTALGLPGGGRVRTVEHLVASLFAFGVDNARVRVDGPEVPILDGSAAPWCERLSSLGTAPQAASRRVLRVLHPVQVAQHGRFVRIEPARPDEQGLELDVTCRHGSSGEVQRWAGRLTADGFSRELARSRSSGAISLLWTAGPLKTAPIRRWLGRRGRERVPVPEPRSEGLEPNGPSPDLSSAVAPDLARVVQPPAGEAVLRGARPGRVAVVVGPWILGGARYPDELVRHFALDLVGDLALCGFPLAARVVAHQPTHALTYCLVATLMRQPEAWTVAPA